MKKLTLLAVTAAALALAATKVEASGGGTNLVLTISGSVQYQLTNSIITKSISSNSVSTTLIGKTKTLSFNNATIYNMISNAVANASNGIAATLPAKGIIEYDAADSDGKNLGFFYVTDKANDFTYSLSGFDTNGDYYSFMELDSWVVTTNGDGNPIQLGFANPFDGSSSYTINANGNGSLSGKSTALLYIHDGPYLYDASDTPGNFYSPGNNEAFEIQGILAVQLTYKTNSISGGSLSLTGAGNALIPNASPGDDNASVISGHASIR